MSKAYEQNVHPELDTNNTINLNLKTSGRRKQRKKKKKKESKDEEKEMKWI